MVVPMALPRQAVVVVVSQNQAHNHIEHDASTGHDEHDCAAHTRYHDNLGGCAASEWTYNEGVVIDGLCSWCCKLTNRN